MLQRARVERSRVLTADAAGAGRLVVEIADGSIHLLPGDAGTVHAAISWRAEAADLQLAEALADGCVPCLELHGSRLVLSALPPRRRGKASRLQVDLRVTVPRRLACDLRCRAGNLRVDEIDGALRAATTSGDVRIGKAAGDVDAVTGSGEIEVESCLGALSARCGAGNVRVRAAAGRLAVRTDAGDVAVRLTAAPPGDGRVATGAGSILLEVAPGIGLAVAARARCGGVTTDFPLTGGGGALAGDVQGGGHRLTLTSGAGDLRLAAVAAAATTATRDFERALD